MTNSIYERTILRKVIKCFSLVKRNYLFNSNSSRGFQYLMATYFIIMTETLFNKYWVSTVVEGAVRTGAQSTKNQRQYTSPFLTSPDNAKCSRMAHRLALFSFSGKMVHNSIKYCIKKMPKTRINSTRVTGPGRYCLDCVLVLTLLGEHLGITTLGMRFKSPFHNEGRHMQWDFKGWQRNQRAKIGKQDYVTIKHTAKETINLKENLQMEENFCQLYI